MYLIDLCARISKRESVCVCVCVCVRVYVWQVRYVCLFATIQLSLIMKTNT